ncbi:hypothetical protein BLA29_013266 [Euroglyphus maynei]|uniref:Uncharacterized protein n=1 Tax=Euroglyphus maynei TaxID=6958 RepID=A0A1Y3AVF1_EURMA|nr:hypothetical protein BLA29_013266 [Euroglyphus maynei]
MEKNEIYVGLKKDFFKTHTHRQSEIPIWKYNTGMQHLIIDDDDDEMRKKINNSNNQQQQKI